MSSPAYIPVVVQPDPSLDTGVGHTNRSDGRNAKYGYASPSVAFNRNQTRIILISLIPCPRYQMDQELMLDLISSPLLMEVFLLVVFCPLLRHTYFRVVEVLLDPFNLQITFLVGNRILILTN